MLSNPGFMVRFAPLLASLALIFSCCYLYDLPKPTPVIPPTPTAACIISFSNPSNGAVFPPSGLETFSWSAVAKAKFYILSISGPGNNGGLNSYPTSNLSWPVDLGSIGGDGTYTAALQARDPDQNILCQTLIHFKLLSPTPTRTPTPTATTKPKPGGKNKKQPQPAPTATWTPKPQPTPVPTKRPTRTPIILK